MCLSKVVRTSGEGYQVRRKNWDGTYSPIYQNGRECYEIGKYYKAKSNLYDKKIHGFHIFLDFLDAKKYKKNLDIKTNKVIVKVRFRNLISYGLHKINYLNGHRNFAAAITAREMKILEEVK